MVERSHSALSKQELIERYNYSVFAPENFQPLMQWDSAPSIGTNGPDFPLWTLDEQESKLSAIWSQHKYTIVEFGSFT